jgi:hypothetical protein
MPLTGMSTAGFHALLHVPNAVHRWNAVQNFWGSFGDGYCCILHRRHNNAHYIYCVWCVQDDGPPHWPHSRPREARGEHRDGLRAPAVHLRYLPDHHEGDDGEVRGGGCAPAPWWPCAAVGLGGTLDIFTFMYDIYTFMYVVYIYVVHFYIYVDISTHMRDMYAFLSTRLRLCRHTYKYVGCRS